MQSNEIRIPKNHGDFDFSPTAQPCQYFKSSYARSLSLTIGTEQTKSLEIGLNFGLSTFENDLGAKILDSSTPTKSGFAFKHDKQPKSLSFGSMGALHAARSLLYTEDNKNSTNKTIMADEAQDANVTLTEQINANVWENQQNDSKNLQVKKKPNIMCIVLRKN